MHYRLLKRAHIQPFLLLHIPEPKHLFLHHLRQRAGSGLSGRRHHPDGRVCSDEPDICRLQPSFLRAALEPGLWTSGACVPDDRVVKGGAALANSCVQRRLGFAAYGFPAYSVCRRPVVMNMQRNATKFDNLPFLSYFFSYLNDSSTQTEEPGGSFSMGMIPAFCLHKWDMSEIFDLYLQVLRTRASIQETSTTSTCQSRDRTGFSL